MPTYSVVDPRTGQPRSVTANTVEEAIAIVQGGTLSTEAQRAADRDQENRDIQAQQASAAQGVGSAAPGLDNLSGEVQQALQRAVATFVASDGQDAARATLESAVSRILGPGSTPRDVATFLGTNTDFKRKMAEAQPTSRNQAILQDPTTTRVPGKLASQLTDEEIAGGGGITPGPDPDPTSDPRIQRILEGIRNGSFDESAGLTELLRVAPELGLMELTKLAKIAFTSRGTTTTTTDVPPAAADFPVTTPQVGDAPTDFTRIFEQMGASDIARNFALNSGVAPAFRNIAERAATRSFRPFGLQASLGNIEGLSFGQFEEDPLGSLREFLQSGPQRLPGIRQSLGQAFDFLGGANENQLPQQEALRNQLMTEGRIGSELFAPTLSLLGDVQGGRSIPGVNIRGATNRALKNVFAQDPTRFGTASDFGSFLKRQGII